MFTPSSLASLRAEGAAGIDAALADIGWGDGAGATGCGACFDFISTTSPLLFGSEGCAARAGSGTATGLLGAGGGGGGAGASAAFGGGSDARARVSSAFA